MKLSILGSGSEGNSTLLTSNQSAILIDAGFSGKEIQNRLDQTEISPHDIEAIVLSHEHGDHVKGAGVLARRFKIPIYATEGTFRAGKVRMGAIPEAKIMPAGASVSFHDIRVTSFSVSHDASDPVAFTIQNDHKNTKIGICTDLGYVTHLVRQRLQNCQTLILEMNHDLQMLIAGRYPWDLKQRIRSKKGHLSNDDASAFLATIWNDSLNSVVIAHISKENNLPELAELSARNALDSLNHNGKTQIVSALQNEITQITEKQKNE